jgi:hypothetical protein
MYDTAAPRNAGNAKRLVVSNRVTGHELSGSLGLLPEFIKVTLGADSKGHSPPSSGTAWSLPVTVTLAAALNG